MRMNTSYKNGIGEGAIIRPHIKRPLPPKLTKPSRERLEEAHTNILMRGASTEKISSLDKIAELAGERPAGWAKPKYGDFDYWLARKCGWIGDDELKFDYDAHISMCERARDTSTKYRWDEVPRYEAPKDTDEYVPEISMKLVNDRNLTDSARRIALFVMRHVYQDNREGRCIRMTVSFVMKGLSLSRRTIQRNLSLLQKHGYLQSDVIPSKKTRMCIGLMISLLSPLFPPHHQKRWPKRRRNSDAPRLTQNQDKNYYTLNDLVTVDRRSWSERCSEGIFRAIIKENPIFGKPISLY